MRILVGGNFCFNSAKGLRVEPYPRSEKVTWNWASLGFIRLAVNSPPTISPSLDKFYFGCSKLFKIFLFCPYFMLDRFKCFLWKHMRAYWTSAFIHLGTAFPPHNRIQSAIIVVSNWNMLAASELKAKGHQQRGLLKLSNKSFFI